jgi:hypothetical protein
MAASPAKACTLGAAQVHAAERLRVLGLERVQQVVHAGADGVDHFLVRLARRGRRGILGERVERAPLDRVVAVVVDQGVAQKPVEPGHRRLLVAQAGPAGDAAHERLLQDLLGHIAAAHPPLEEGQEALVVLDQHAQHLGREPEPGRRGLSRPPSALAPPSSQGHGQGQGQGQGGGQGQSLALSCMGVHGVPPDSGSGREARPHPC